MFFIPLNQAESVELVIHALRMAGGEADCSSCPARKVCMKQCLTIAEAVQRMLEDGTLPALGGIGGTEAPPEEAPARSPDAAENDKDEKTDKGRHLKIIK